VYTNTQCLYMCSCYTFRVPKETMTPGVKNVVLLFMFLLCCCCTTHAFMRVYAQPQPGRPTWLQCLKEGGTSKSRHLKGNHLSVLPCDTVETSAFNFITGARWERVDAW
jgi:hypothetical protein